MIRIAIVGCGRILNAHLQGYKILREAGVDDFRITALVARQKNDALMFRKRGEGPEPRPPVVPPESGDSLAAPHTYLSDFQDDVDVEVYTDYVEMLDNAPVDAVNDFTTLALHHQIADESYAHDMHLLTQKPLAISVAAAQRMVKGAVERGLTLGTFENVRQGKYTRAAAWAVRKGLIGDPQLAVLGSLGGLWSPDRVVADTPWRHKKLLAGGGGTIDIGVHQFHLLRYVFGEVAAMTAVTQTLEPKRYRRDDAGNAIETVEVDVDDTHLAIASMENDATAQLLWSWGMHGLPVELEASPAFYGSEGCILGETLVTDSGKSTSLLDTFDEQITEEERELFFPLGLTNAYAIQQLDWLQSIKQGKDPETSGQEGLLDLACAFAMLESSAARRQVTLEDVLSGEVSGYQDEINEHYGL